MAGKRCSRTDQESGQLFDRLLRRATGRCEPAASDREHRAAPATATGASRAVARHGMNLIDDHGLDVPQDLAALAAGQHQVERFRRGDQNVRRPANHPLPLAGRRVAGANQRANVGAFRMIAAGQLQDLCQRPLQVSLNVVGQGSQAARRKRHTSDREAPPPARGGAIGRGWPETRSASCPSRSGRRSAYRAAPEWSASRVAAAPWGLGTRFENHSAMTGWKLRNDMNDSAAVLIDRLLVGSFTDPESNYTPWSEQKSGQSRSRDDPSRRTAAQNCSGRPRFAITPRDGDRMFPSGRGRPAPGVSTD